MSSGAAHAQAVAAAAPHDVSVTVYRDPDREKGGFDLDELGGFAFITETRRVVIPPGEHTLRFEGVADGIEPVSAIVTGLPSGVIEKNRDAALLSPEALVDATQAQGGRVQLLRTDPATGARSEPRASSAPPPAASWSRRRTASRRCAVPACPRPSPSTPSAQAFRLNRRSPSSRARRHGWRRWSSSPIWRAASTGRPTTSPAWAPRRASSISAPG